MNNIKSMFCWQGAAVVAIMWGLNPHFSIILRVNYLFCFPLVGFDFHWYTINIKKASLYSVCTPFGVLQVVSGCPCQINMCCDLSGFQPQFSSFSGTYFIPMNQPLSYAINVLDGNFACVLGFVVLGLNGLTSLCSASAWKTFKPAQVYRDSSSFKTDMERGRSSSILERLHSCATAVYDLWWHAG